MASYSKLIAAETTKRMLKDGGLSLRFPEQHERMMVAFWEKVAKKFRLYRQRRGKWTYRDKGAEHSLLGGAIRPNGERKL